MGGMSFLERNAKVVLALAIVAILAGLGYAGLQFVQSRQERVAQNAYYDAEKDYVKIRDGFDQARFRTLRPEVRPDAPQAEDARTSAPATGDLEKDYGSVLAKLEAVALEHKGTAGGAQAAILVAETYLNYNQPDKAVEFARIPAESLPAGHVLGTLAKTLLGNAMAAKNDCQGAVRVWQQVLDAKSATYLHPEVSLRSGLCYESLNQPDKAAEMYRKVIVDAADTTAGSTAKGLLRALEIKTKTQPTAARQG